MVAQLSLSVCDRCARRSDEVDVEPWQARRGANRTAGDLCDACWTELLNLFQPVPVSRTRQKIVITDPKKLPRKRK